MASLSNHKVIEVYVKPGTTMRYHITAAGWVLRTTGPRLGGAKLVYIAKPGDLTTINAGGRGKRASR